MKRLRTHSAASAYAVFTHPTAIFRGPRCDRHPATLPPNLWWVASRIQWRIRIRVIGNPPEFEHGARDQLFGRLYDTGSLDIIGVGTRIRRRTVVFEAAGVNVVASVWMCSPAEVHVRCIRVVKLLTSSPR